MPADFLLLVPPPLGSFFNVRPFPLHWRSGQFSIAPVEKPFLSSPLPTFRPQFLSQLSPPALRVKVFSMFLRARNNLLFLRFSRPPFVYLSPRRAFTRLSISSIRTFSPFRALWDHFSFTLWCFWSISFMPRSFFARGRTPSSTLFPF